MHMMMRMISIWLLLILTWFTSAHSFNNTLFFPFILNGTIQEGYTVSLKVGVNMPFQLKMDTETDVTWIQCTEICQGCSLPPKKRYEPDIIVKCGDTICQEACVDPHADCVFNTKDSSGVLVKDVVTDAGKDHVVFPELAFGCGFDQHYSGPDTPSFVGGVLGMGDGKGSFVDQLYNLGLTRKISGHCISSKGGGFVFFGDYFVNMNAKTHARAQLESSTSNSGKKFDVGVADLIFDGKPTPAKGLEVAFDSGKTYTYLNDQAYTTVYELLVGAVHRLKRTNGVLPVCWKGHKPFQSLKEVEAFFKPMALSFSSSYNFDLPLLSYLVITEDGNVCLGILKGSEYGLGTLNLIGDISFQDKMVVYYHQENQITWTTGVEDCDLIP